MKYKIRYTEFQSSPPNYKYTEVDKSTIQIITGLQLGTSYIISVMAQNKVGKSAYTNEIRAITSSKFFSISYCKYGY